MGQTNDDIVPPKWLGALMMDDERGVRHFIGHKILRILITLISLRD